ncbi:MAG: hypothetical protein Q9218_005301, partial [Villophora microphyllina]
AVYERGASKIMAILEDLSNELIQEIINYTFREDLVNFATASRRIHDLSQSALEGHRDFQERYCKISTSIAEDGFVERITTGIIKDFRIGLYVTTLRIEGWFMAWLIEDMGEGFPKHDKPSESILSLLKNAACERLPLSASSTIEFSVEDGNQGLTLALLLLLLPNLHNLYVRTQQVQDMEPADCYYLDAALDELQKGKLADLPKIDSVELVCSGSQSFSTFERFLQIPSLRVMQVGGLEASHIETELKSLSLEWSTIKALIFRNCAIDSKLMASIIEYTGGLECFSYTSMDLYEDPMSPDTSETQPDPYWLRMSLLATSRETLQVLQLLPHGIDEKKSTPNSVHRYSGSLKGFRNLRTIIIDFLLLFGGDLLSRHTFLTELPESVHNVLLYIPYMGDGYSDDEEGEEELPTKKRDDSRGKEPVIRATVLEHALQKLRTGKKESLPNLSKVMIVGLDEDVVKDVSARGVIEGLQRVGVDVTLVPSTSDEAFVVRYRMRSVGFYDEQPWYYEGMNWAD